MESTTNRHPPDGARNGRRGGAIKQLVQRAGSGDDRAWDSLVEEFGARVWSVTRALRLSDADAADVAQTTWLRLVEHVDRLHEPAYVGDWLATTARRESLRILGRVARVVPAGDDLPEPVDETPEHATRAFVQERDDALWSAFSDLDERDQSLLRLTLSVPSLTYKQIGDALQMPVGSIGPTRKRALNRLRRKVECRYPAVIEA